MPQLLILMAALLLAACGNGADTVLLGTLERDRVELVAESQEPIIAIEVREGESVSAGQVLLRLDPSAQQARLAQASSAAAVAERRVAELVAGARSEQVREARAQREAALAREQSEKREFERLESMVARRLVAETNLDRQRAQRDAAAAELRAASERLALLESGTRAEVVAQARAALEQAKAQVSEAGLTLERMVVRAPGDGVIDALPYELGERPPRGAPVVIMLAAGQPYARVFVPQPLRAQLANGAKATVRMDGREQDYTGELRFISAEAAFTPYYALNERDRSRLSFLAEVVLTGEEARTLPTGMPVEVVFGPAEVP